MRIGIDVGGTKTEVAAIDAHGAFLVRRRVPTPRDDYAATVETIATLVESVEADLGERASVGIGTPGAISAATGRIKNANSTWLNGRPLRDDVERRLKREIRMTNDANALALSEAIGGAAAGARVVFAAILGTGVGGGIAFDGRVHDGPNAISGEWGHIQLPWLEESDRPLPRCWCGRDGCIESFLSGPALARDGGDLDRYVHRLARALATIVNVLDPDTIVLGGGVSNVDRLYADVPPVMNTYVFSDAVQTPLVRALHGDSSGVRGAALLWED